METQTEEYRMAFFLYSIGTKAIKTYNSFDMTDETHRNLSEIMKEFDKYAIGETNETYERYIFNSRDQKEEENIDRYVAELRTLAQSCGFCKCLNDSLIRDRIVRYKDVFEAKIFKKVDARNGYCHVHLNDSLVDLLHLTRPMADIAGDSHLVSVWQLPDTKASTMIKKLKCHFARQGIPDTFISDNGPTMAFSSKLSVLLSM
ncbi:hypothetical protein QZH41_020082 [Actinostola sp. cb2023]|nr:hypothetical protein QZH41_020082 [Actinostola sp. cb2023]